MRRATLSVSVSLTSRISLKDSNTSFVTTVGVTDSQVPFEPLQLSQIDQNTGLKPFKKTETSDWTARDLRFLHDKAPAVKCTVIFEFIL